MRKLFTLILFAVSSSIFAQADIIGSWDTGEENGVIEILNNDNNIIGKIKSSDNSKAPIGKLILKDLTKDGDTWEGKIFAVKKGEWYDAVFEVKDDQLLIEVSVGIFSKTIEWKKV